MSNQEDQYERAADYSRILRAIRGDIIAGLDGYYVYWPERLSGGMSSSLLRMIADELDKMNSSWDRKFNECMVNAFRAKVDGANGREPETKAY